LSETILALIEQEVLDLVHANTGGDPMEWGREALRAQMLALVPTLGPDELAVIDESRDVDTLANELVDVVAARYEARRVELGDEGMAALQRIVLLRVIDGLWVEHLTAVDDMRRGIGLRAYSQRDPLNEFKVEAFGMFDELKATIRHDVAHTLFRVTVVREPATRPAPTRMLESRPDISGAGGNGAAAGAVATATATQQPVRAGVKIGRNDPCYCGSGKKYKKCHGA
jgi:preprotein translocase subunit SecA